MTKKFFYCEKCGSCRANDERDPRTEMPCPFCENAMVFKGSYDWSATAKEDREHILESWSEAARESGLLNMELFNARKRTSPAEEAPKKAPAPVKAEGLERIGPILRRSAKGIGFIGVLLFVTFGTLLAVFGGSPALLVAGIAVAVLGSFFSVVSILLIYALGELIVRTGEVSMNTRR